jgi:hypothetical protein
MMSLLFAGVVDHNDNAVETGMNVQRKGNKRDVCDILSTTPFPLECNGLTLKCVERLYYMYLYEGCDYAAILGLACGEV